MSKRLVVIAAIALALVPLVTIAQEQESDATTQEEAYRAVVLSSKEVAGENGAIQQYQVKFLEGPQEGTSVTIGDDEAVSSIGNIIFRKGDKVYVSVLHHISGTDRYLITDYARSNALWWLIGAFVLAIIWFSRWQGVRSLIGLVISFAVIIGWIVPQISNGANPVLVTLVGSAVTLVIGFVLIEGFTRMAWAATLGTSVTMIIVGLIAMWSISFSHLTGQSTEEAFFLQGALQSPIDLRGLLLAGIIIGTLGILDDLAVSQVAAVGELRRANPGMSNKRVYAGAMRIGRSHLAAIINTLMLAYAGASLPLLILFSKSGLPFDSIVNGELVATEIARSIIGSLGLILAVPITTLAAVWLKVVAKPHHDDEPEHHHLANPSQV